LEATTTSNVVTYQVVIEAPNPDLKLKPGLTASASIYTVEESGVVLVPTKAFRFTPDQDQVKQMKEVRFSPALQVDSKKTNQKVVWVKSANKVYPKLITIGLTDGINAVVADGLAVDEEVVTGMSQNVIVGGSDSQSTGATETSPFMPKPPGGSKTKK
jgi:HlyD family secretion protein